MNDREQFEAWFTENGKHPLFVTRSPDGSYRHSPAESAWEVWQAARATPAQPVPDLYEAEKLLPYEIRYFKTPGMAEGLGYKVLATYHKIAAPSIPQDGQKSEADDA